MRTREEIYKRITDSTEGLEIPSVRVHRLEVAMNQAILETLLDIRDLLSHPPKQDKEV